MEPKSQETENPNLFPESNTDEFYQEVQPIPSPSYSYPRSNSTAPVEVQNGN